MVQNSHIIKITDVRLSILEAGGKPSTRFPPGRLVELRFHKLATQANLNKPAEHEIDNAGINQLFQYCSD